MKFIPLNIQNLKIATYQSNGNKLPVVFLHASSIGAASFYKQMISKEGEEFKFISIDMPGHGASDFSFKPKEFYNFNKLCDLMIETIESLNIGSFILVGHFHGAHIALNISEKLQHLKGLILTGFSPIKDYNKWSDSYKTNEIFELLYKSEVDAEEAAKLAQIFVSQDNMADISFVDNIKNTDPNFREYFTESLATLKINDFDKIKKSTIPISIILGNKDRTVNYNNFDSITQYLWRNKIQTISETGNSPMWENPKIFNYFMQEFIKDLI